MKIGHSRLYNELREANEAKAFFRNSRIAVVVAIIIIAIINIA